jgi:hypothetical protein
MGGEMGSGEGDPKFGWILTSTGTVLGPSVGHWYAKQYLRGWK